MEDNKKETLVLCGDRIVSEEEEDVEAMLWWLLSKCVRPSPPSKVTSFICQG